MACLFPATYRQYREVLCILSHMMHKVVQLLVTVTPPVGTIYSPTYNTTGGSAEPSWLEWSDAMAAVLCCCWEG